MRHSITFVVPAYNEENNLEESVRNIVEAASALPLDFDVVIIDDASRDRTPAVADALARTYPQVRVIHNSTNLGFGQSYRRGIQEVRTEYLLLVPGDNDFMVAGLRKILAAIGRADFIEHYPLNPEARPWIRRLVSGGFVRLMNCCFALRLPYFTGITIYKKEHLDQIPFHTRDFTFNAQILVKGIKQGHTFFAVGVKNSPRRFGKSSIFKLKNVISCLWSIGALWVEVMLLRRSAFKKVGASATREGLYDR